MMSEVAAEHDQLKGSDKECIRLLTYSCFRCAQCERICSHADFTIKAHSKDR